MVIDAREGTIRTRIPLLDRRGRISENNAGSRLDCKICFRTRVNTQHAAVGVGERLLDRTDCASSV
jgi:hypothetical protein